MNTFFYAAAADRCGEKCNYMTCCKKCLSRFADRPFFEKLRILPGGSNLTTPHAMDLRSGDILILYAQNKDDIDRLVALRDHLRTFRIILVVGEKSLVLQGSHYSLNPRFTTSLENNMEEITAVIDRITGGAGYSPSLSLSHQEQSHA